LVQILLSQLIIMVFAVFLTCSNNATAGQQPSSPKEIAHNIITAQNKLTDLTIHFTRKIPLGVYRKKQITGVRTVQGLYAHKTTTDANQPLRYLSRIATITNQETNQTTLAQDYLLSFNGESTFTLDQPVESNQQPVASIKQGYSKKLFPDAYNSANSIWLRAAEYFGHPESTFRIQKRNEYIDGLSCTKVTGTLLDGQITLEYWISADRSYLPLKMQALRDDGNQQQLKADTILSDLVQLENGIWLPGKIVYNSYDPAFVEFTRTWNLSSISIDPIPKEFFTPQFPPGTRVHDGILGITYTTY